MNNESTAAIIAAVAKTVEAALAKNSSQRSSTSARASNAQSSSAQYTCANTEADNHQMQTALDSIKTILDQHDVVDNKKYRNIMFIQNMSIIYNVMASAIAGDKQTSDDNKARTHEIIELLNRRVADVIKYLEHADDVTKD